MEKVCVNHPESPSVGSCKACEKPVCLMCITEVQGVSFCSDACGAAYQEVKDWLERPAAEEEKDAEAAHADPVDEVREVDDILQLNAGMPQLESRQQDRREQREQHKHARAGGAR